MTRKHPFKGDGKAEDSLSRFWQQKVEPFAVSAAPFVAQLACSSAAYSLTLSSCHVFFGTLRVHCATPFLGPACGFAAVALASSVAGHVGRHTLACLRAGHSVAYSVLSLPSSLMHLHGRESLTDALLGTAIFKVGRGDFRRVLPSHLAKPGAFGFMSVPTSSSEYATSGEKSQLVRIFARDGCHHCGRWRAEVIGDHIPPYKLVKAVAAELEAMGSLQRKLVEMGSRMGLVDTSLKQVYYAQCRPCSQTQAQLMRNGTRRVFAPLLWPPELMAHSLARQLTRCVVPGALVGSRPCVDWAICGPSRGHQGGASHTESKPRQGSQVKEVSQGGSGCMDNKDKDKGSAGRKTLALWFTRAELGG